MLELLEEEGPAFDPSTEFSQRWASTSTEAAKERQDGKRYPQILQVQDLCLDRPESAATFIHVAARHYHE